MRQASQPLTGWLYYASLAIGIAPCLFGLTFILNGDHMAEAYGIPLSKLTRQQDPVYAYLAANGVRDLALGVLAISFALLRDRRAVGLVQIGGIITAAGDGMVVLKYAGRDSKGVLVNFGIAFVLAVLALLTFRQPAAQSTTRKKVS